MTHLTYQEESVLTRVTTVLAIEGDCVTTSSGEHLHLDRRLTCQKQVTGVVEVMANATASRTLLEPRDEVIILLGLEPDNPDSRGPVWVTRYDYVVAAANA